jgi:3-methylcrotonyl-CoA carboxylase alpha subunit
LPPPDLARVDSGVREGDLVTPYYDAMIAKIVVCGEDRPAAIGRLRRALAATAVVGVHTNLGLLARVAGDPDFVEGAVDTGFIERHRAAMLEPTESLFSAALAAAVLTRLSERQAAARAAVAGSGDVFSPWALSSGWQLCGNSRQDVVLRYGVTAQTVAATAGGGGWLLRLGDREFTAAGDVQPDGVLTLMLDGVQRRVRVLDHGTETVVFIDGESWEFEEIDPLASTEGEDPTAGKLTAPMPGRVTRLLTEVGAKVRRGEPLMAIEAMKMEHTITAPADGVVAAVRFAVGELVDEGVELIALAASATGPN